MKSVYQIQHERERMEPLDAYTEAEIEQELRAFEAAERERLGLDVEDTHWTDSMLNLRFTARERDQVTILVSGLTAMQDSLMEAALKGMGYRVSYFGIPDNEAFRYGKEYGNRGQCNPTYFTVGHLIKYLVRLRDEEGLSTEHIIRHYAYLTAGACGPCRFGMYLTEYRKALRDAGFEGFRVVVYQQHGGAVQGEDGEGLPITPEFYWKVGKSIVCGDILNALGYRIRPYEVDPGATDRALEHGRRIVYDALAHNTSMVVALARVRRELARIKVDRLRPRAKVSIIGEFWAMTTEGDGNYRLQRFLESEGGECDIQLTTAWMLYTLWEWKRDTRERMHLRGADGAYYGLARLHELGVAERLVMLDLTELALRSAFRLFARTAGLLQYHLPDMDEVADVAHQYYCNDLRGGEGHMEVGKFILNTLHHKTHITVSVKPFGCMPSSGVSDGVQSLIAARYPGSIFAAVETSGDGAVNFCSRVQMVMFKARQAAEAELQRCLDEEGVTLEEVRSFLTRRSHYNHALHAPLHRDVAGSAANLVREVAPLIRLSWAERARASMARRLTRTRDVLMAASQALSHLRTLAQDAPELRDRARTDLSVLLGIAREKLPGWLEPLQQRLSSSAAPESGAVA